MAKTAKEKVEKKAKKSSQKKAEEEITVEQKLIALYQLQQTDSQIQIFLQCL